MTKNTDANDKREDYPKKIWGSVVLDPPWSLHQKGRRGASQHYELMSDEQIAGLPVNELLEDGGHAWIWCTNQTRYLAETIAREKWGLTFRSELIWDKRKMGLGNFLRSSHESVLLFSKGPSTIRFKGQRTVADWPVQAHSQKPEEFLTVVQRCSPGPYLELFARARFPGFDAWGNETPGGADVFIPNYPVPNYSKRATNPTPGADDGWRDGVIRKAA